MTSSPRSSRTLSVRLAWLGVACVCVTGTLVAQMATPDRLQSPGWWPTKGTAERESFVGTDTCIQCHRSLSTQLTTAMARTAERAENSPVLKHTGRLTFGAGPYTYTIGRTDGRIVYAVSDGERTVATPLAWALGAGTVGQTYVFEDKGVLHETRASYYSSIHRLDFTPTRRLTHPRDMEHAMARALEEAEARRCFGCHTTASSTVSGFDLDRAVPGVTCEACHGPGRAHVLEMERDDPPTPGTMMNPRRLDAIESVDLCGACHATFWDVALAGERGLAALRSQPYRLQSSRCWGDGDARITCVACHDPHRPLVRDLSSYDANCLSCHSASAAPSCPTGTERCAGCHMPKYDVPEMHTAFTDHLIRIDRR